MSDPSHSSKPKNDPTPWTAGGIAFLILLAVFCAFLVMNAFHREDIFFTDVMFESMIPSEIESVIDGSASLGGVPHALQIHQTYYPRGLGVYTPSEIETRHIPPGYSYFMAEIGVDAQILPGGPAAVIFTVLGDGTVLYESPPLRPGMEPRQVYAPIAGRQKLTLRAVSAIEGIEVPVNWALARFRHR